MKNLVYALIMAFALAVGAPAFAAMIDLNTASQSELESLPGVGAKTAEEIISHRPFKSVDDLKHVKGIGKAKFDKLKDLVEVAPPPAVSRGTAAANRASSSVSSKMKLAPGEKININTASESDLEKLPGIGPERAKAIIDGRPYSNPEDVMKVKGIKEGIFSAIKPYVTTQ